MIHNIHPKYPATLMIIFACDILGLNLTLGSVEDEHNKFNFSLWKVKKVSMGSRINAAWFIRIFHEFLLLISIVDIIAINIFGRNTKEKKMMVLMKTFCVAATGVYKNFYSYNY